MEQNEKRIVIDREELLDELEAMSNANTLVSHIFGSNNAHLFRQMLDVVIEAVENMTAHEIDEETLNNYTFAKPTITVNCHEPEEQKP